MKGRGRKQILLVLVLLSLSSVVELGAQSASVNMTSEITSAAVYGTEDIGYVAATEFLDGCAHDLSPCLHMPSDLRARAKHLHLNKRIRDYRAYYTDPTVSDGSGGSGNDVDPDHGLENSTVLFYAGDGYKDFFYALYESIVPLSDFSLGDGDVRYLWMLSCNVMAHGPSGSGDFLQPENFDPDQWRKSPEAHANAFARWTGGAGKKVPLNPGLRLACGGSSQIGGVTHPTHLLWHYYSIVGLSPAESFLLGLYTPHNGGLPLCMSRGGDSLTTSGLADGRFVADRLNDWKRVYMQFPLPAESTDPLVAAATSSNSIRYVRSTKSRNDAPDNLPVLKVTGAPVPPILGGIDFSGAPALPYGFRGASAKDLRANLDFLQPLSLPPGIVGENLCLKRHPGSGALSLSWRPQPGVGFLPNETAKEVAQEIIKLAVAGKFGAGFGSGPPLNKFMLREAQAIVMRVDSVSAEKAASSELSLKDITHPEKCRYLRLTSVYREGATEVPVFGEGGEIFLGVCAPESVRPDPASGNESNPCHREGSSSLSVFLGGRVVTGERKEGTRAILTTRIAAQQEALGRLLRSRKGNLYNPIPRSYRWGYRAAPVHCTQKEMYIVYEFDFVPKDSPVSDELPPVTIEVPAHRLPEGKEKIEDTWECSPEKAV